MDIFYINSDTFLNNVDLNSLDYFLEGKSFKSEKQKRQFCLGRFLVKYIASVKFGVQNTELEIVNKKPKFIYSDINFSISHSKNIVLAAFDSSPVGVDIEFIKPRKFAEIFKYYNLNVENPSQEYFYRFWTEYEAGIKLQMPAKSTAVFQLDNFMLAVKSYSSLGIKSRLKIYELKSPVVNTNPNELISLKPVSDNKKNENALVIQDINTASLTSFSPLNLNIE